MRRIRTLIAINVAVSMFSAVAAGQSVELRRFVTDNLKRLYGDQAPPSVTFVTLPNVSREQPSPRIATGAPGGRGQVRYSMPGDTATGTVIAQRGNELYLDSDPCNGKVASFVKPFTQTETGKVTCANEERQLYKVVQQ